MPCVFCKIIAREIPAAIIAESDDLIVIKDRSPKAPIHYLIIPKIHVADVRELRDEHAGIGSAIFAMAQKLSTQIGTPNDFALHMNNGHMAGQRVYHAHMHFLAGADLSSML